MGSQFAPIKSAPQPWTRIIVVAWEHMYECGAMNAYIYTYISASWQKESVFKIAIYVRAHNTPPPQRVRMILWVM